MSDTAFVLLVIVAGIFALAALLGVGIAVLVRVEDLLDHRRRERAGMTDREVANSIDPGNYGVDISMWPSRAPRNGSAHEDAA
jgi:hypothetical protein